MAERGGCFFNLALAVSALWCNGAASDFLCSVRRRYSALLASVSNCIASSSVSASRISCVMFIRRSSARWLTGRPQVDTRFVGASCSGLSSDVRRRIALAIVAPRGSASITISKASSNDGAPRTLEMSSSRGRRNVLHSVCCGSVGRENQGGNQFAGRCRQRSLTHEVARGQGWAARAAYHRSCSSRECPSHQL